MDYKDTDVYQVSLVTSSGTAYASGDVIDTLRAITDPDAYQPQRFHIVSAQVLDRDDQGANIDVVFCNQSMTAGTFTDNAAAAFNDAEASKVVGVAHIVDHTSLGGSGISASGPIDIPVNLQSSTALHAVAIARAARTHTSVAGMLLRLGIVQAGNKP